MRSDIAHYEGLDIWGPFGLAELEALLAPLTFEPGMTALDVGCGDARVLIGLARRHGLRITGIDMSAGALRQAAERCAREAPDTEATWIEAAFNDVELPDASFDMIMELGGPYRNDSRPETFALFRRWLRPGGYLIYGDGFWMQPPPAEYLEAVGIPADFLLSREGYLAQAGEAGWQSRSHFICSREGWDHFENTIQANYRAYGAAHPEDEAFQKKLAAKQVWHAAQERWGRDTMGFCVDVFQQRTD